MAKSKSGDSGMIGQIFKWGILLAVILMILGGFIDSATNANAEWVLALRETTDALDGSVVWFGLLITASFGGLAYLVVTRVFNK